MMTSRERLLAALRGGQPDHTPFAPFLAYFWEAQPAAVQEKGMCAFCESVGADFLLRGSHLLFQTRQNRCDVRVQSQIGVRRTIYETPVGSIAGTETYVRESGTWFLTEHPVKTAEDFKVLLFLLQNTELVPDYSKYEEDKRQLGERGLYVPAVSPQYKTGFQSLVEHWMGVEALNYLLSDEPELVEEAVSLFSDLSNRSVQLSLQSSAEAFLFWENTSTTLINPAQFRRYVLPEVEQWAAMIHAADKILIHHACGLVANLFGDMCTSSVDWVDSLAPLPTGDMDVAEAFRLLPPQKGIIGGIDPVFLLNCTLEQLEACARQLLDLGKGRRYILSNSDSCPPGVQIEKFRLLSRLARQS